MVIRPEEGFELNIEMAEQAHFDFRLRPHRFFNEEGWQLAEVVRSLVRSVMRE